MTMITSPHNEKLKLIRKLRERKHREREGLFASEGEDLLEAGLAAGWELHLLLGAAGSGLGGEEVDPEVLAGSPRSARARARSRSGRCRRVGARRGAMRLPARSLDPGNVGAIVRTAGALLGGASSSAPGAPTPTRQGGAGEHGLDLRPAAAAGGGRGDAPAAGRPSSPTAGGAGGAGRRRRSAWARSGRACPPRCWRSAICR